MPQNYRTATPNEPVSTKYEGIRARNDIVVPREPDTGTILPRCRTVIPISHFAGMAGAASPVRAHLGGTSSSQRERARYLRMSKPNVLLTKYSSIVWRSIPIVT